MEQKVTVIALEGQQALVEARRASACGDCAGKASCSTMGSWSDRFARLRVTNSVHARVGDEVLLDVPDSMLLKVAFRLYAVPMISFVMLGLVVRVLAVQADWPLPEVWAAAGGVAGVLATYAWMLHQGRYQTVALDARMVRIIHSASSISIRSV